MTQGLWSDKRETLFLTLFRTILPVEFIFFIIQEIFCGIFTDNFLFYLIQLYIY